MSKDRGLYTDEHAKLNMANSIGKPYRPSNWSEGEMFFEAYCEDCKRGGSCEIAGATMCFDIGEKGYPKEWIYGDDGQPTCLAFEEK